MTKGFIKKALHISLHAPKKPRALKLPKLATPADLPQMNEKIKEAPFAAGWRHNFDDGGFIPTPPRRPVELSGDDASRAFPAIWKNVNPIVKYNMGRQGGYAETYPPRETGDPKNPKSIRPKEFGKAGPNARTGIEVYRPEMTGSDLALELLHADPRAISTRNTLLPTMSPEQLEELRHREDYKYSIEEKLPQKKAYENAMDAAARSYLANKRDLPHNQGPAKDIDYMNYTDEQKKHLDNLYNYMMTGEYARGGEVWDKPRPKDLGKPHHLSSKQKATAKAAAKAAGRPYPNLIDNMRAAKKEGGGAWTRKEGKNPNGGLNAKGRASLKAEGHDIKPPQPEGGARRDSFCARMKGMKAKLTSKETANDPNSRINKSLRAWNCHADGGVITDALRLAHKIQRKK